MVDLPSIVTVKNGSFADEASDTVTSESPQEIEPATDKVEAMQRKNRRMALIKVNTPFFYG